MTGKAKKPGHSDEHGVRHITRGSDNLFEDLGFERAEATHLLAETDAAILHRLAVRQMLADAVAVWIEENHLKQAGGGNPSHIAPAGFGFGS
jgi:hypothetical protein